MTHQARLFIAALIAAGSALPSQAAEPPVIPVGLAEFAWSELRYDAWCCLFK